MQGPLPPKKHIHPKCAQALSSKGGFWAYNATVVIGALRNSINICFHPILQSKNRRLRRGSAGSFLHTWRLDRVFRFLSSPFSSYFVLIRRPQNTKGKRVLFRNLGVGFGWGFPVYCIPTVCHRG